MIFMSYIVKSRVPVERCQAPPPSPLGNLPFLHLRPISRTRPQPPMPSRLRSALPRSLSRPLEPGGAYYCPSCPPCRRTLATQTRINTNGDKFDRARGRRQLKSSSATHLRPFTTSPAINPGKTVPPRFKELYDALSGVKDAAIEQVSISRLQLALRGLESEAPLIRISGEF
jgi:hypothetical protein